MDWLEKETVIRVGQHFRSVGGADALSPQILSQCYSRMSSWVALAQEGLKAEWPSFEAVQAFSVFQLRPRLEMSVIKKDLGKIAQIFQDKHLLPSLVRSFSDCISDCMYTANKKSALSNNLSWLIPHALIIIRCRLSVESAMIH